MTHWVGVFGIELKRGIEKDFSPALLGGGMRYPDCIDLRQNSSIVEPLQRLSKHNVFVAKQSM
jgi:hypothetical protein